MSGRPELCVGAVVVDGGRILLIQRDTEPNRGMWTLPGGRVEAGEAMVSAVLRELREETGLTGLCGSMVGWVERMGVDHHFVIIDFQVEVLEDGPLMAGSDARDVSWVEFDDLSEVNLVDGLAAFLADHDVVPATAVPF